MAKSKVVKVDNVKLEDAMRYSARLVDSEGNITLLKDVTIDQLTNIMKPKKKK